MKPTHKHAYQAHSRYLLACHFLENRILLKNGVDLRKRIDTPILPANGVSVKAG